METSLTRRLLSARMQKHLSSSDIATNLVAMFGFTKFLTEDTWIDMIILFGLRSLGLDVLKLWIKLISEFVEKMPS